MSAIAVEDRLAIQELVAQYSFHTDTKDFATVAALFAEDGAWDETVLGAPAAEGRAAIAAAFAAMAAANIGAIVHINGAHRITACDGETASGTSHLHAEVHAMGHEVRILGYYDDEYVKRDGRWLFARRTLVELAPTTGLPGQTEIDAVTTGAQQ